MILHHNWFPPQFHRIFISDEDPEIFSDPDFVIQTVVSWLACDIIDKKDSHIITTENWYKKNTAVCADEKFANQTIFLAFSDEIRDAILLVELNSN